MATVTFYEKPGCANNTRQKVLLAASGHTVWAKNLLTEPWTPERLRPFFGQLPVAEWFNLSAPRIRDGGLDYAALSEAEALALMVREPLLIRRPLMLAEGECLAGFDPEVVAAWIGLAALTPRAPDLERCPRVAQPCPTTETA